MVKSKKLGKVQRSCLDGIAKHGSWWPGCGWIWNTRSGTIRIFDALAKAGMVVKSGNQTTPVYTITEDGKNYLEGNRWRS